MATDHLQSLLDQVRSLDPESLDREIAELKGKLAGLGLLARVAALRDGEPPKVKPRKPAAKGPNMEAIRAGQVGLVTQLERYLGYNQPCKTEILAAEIGRPAGEVRGTLEGDRRFSKTPGGWILTRRD